MTNTIDPVRLLSDEPSSSDQFQAHTRIAETVANIIDTQDGGRVIGIEGSWGAGKSTIIRIAQRLVEERSSSNLVLVFDAWAHQNDPLRRSFLESLLASLSEKGWLTGKEARAADWRASLTGRVETSTTDSTPHLTRTGIILAIATACAPLGLILLDLGRQIGVTAPQAGLALNLFYITGAIISAFPLVAVSVLLWVGWRRQSKMPKEKRIQGTLPLLVGEQQTRLVTTKMSTPNPTSVEFETMFVDILGTALTLGRRLIVVLDNLDRVPATETQAILATLQPFISSSNGSRHHWLSGFWMILPYDDQALRRAFSDHTVNPSEPLQSQHFLDKLIQIRLRVPPPVISSRQEYLAGLIRTAFPTIDTAEEEAVTQVIVHQFKGTETLNSPRKLKSVVNDLAAAYIRWRSEIPLRDLALAVALPQTGPRTVAEQEKEAETLRTLQRWLSPEPQRSIAAIRYGVEPALALQMYIRDRIAGILKTTDQEQFWSLARTVKGFWPAMLVTIDELEDNGVNLETLAYILSQDNQSDATDSVGIHALVRDFVPLASAMEWDIKSPTFARDILAIVDLSQRYRLSAGQPQPILRKAQQLLSNNNPEPVIWARAQRDLQAGCAQRDLLDLYKTNPITLAETVDRAFIQATELAANGVNDRQVTVSASAALLSGIDEHARSLTSTNGPDEHQVGAIVFLSHALSWLSDPFPSTLQAQQSLVIHWNSGPPEPISQALRLWWELRDTSRAHAYLTDSIRGGYLLSHLYYFSTSPANPQAGAWLVYVLLTSDFAEIPQSGPGQSQAGWGSLLAYLATPSSSSLNAITPALFALIFEKGRFDLPFAMQENWTNSHAWLKDWMTWLMAEESRMRRVTWDLFFSHWPLLIKVVKSDVELDAVSQAFLQAFLRIDGSAKHIGTTAFSSSAVPLYLAVCRSMEEPSPDLTHWLGKGLETLTERDWLADLEGEEIALRLAATLLKTGQPISLGTPYHIALRKYADAAATGRTDALVSADTAIDVLSDPKAREDLSKTLLATVSKYARTGIPDDFFTVFGSFLVAVDDGLVDASFASDIVVELISQGSHKQLDWLLKVVERHTATIRRVADPDFRGSVQDRVDTRLESLSDSPNDPRVAVLERIRELLIAGNS